MIKKSLLFLGALFFLKQACAAPINLDVYGVDSHLQKKIIASCSERVRTYLTLEKKINTMQKGSTTELKTKLKHEKQLILKDVNRYGRFRFAKLSVVHYPDDQSVYATIDLVPAKDSDRFPASPKRLIKKNMHKDPEFAQLFKLWQDYFQGNLKKAQQGVLDFNSKSCPFDHCVWGFDKAELKQLVPQFKAGALKYKNELMDVVRFSDKKQEREDAIFLLAHTEDYEPLVRFLIDYIDDSESLIRNDSMRVIGGILYKHEVSGIDVHKVIKALNYPYVTDRNKASFILFNLVQKNKAVHPVIIQESGDTLVSLLKLKQPNNHDFAYFILRVMSGKNYADHDYAHWQQWLNSEKNKLNKA